MKVVRADGKQRKVCDAMLLDDGLLMDGCGANALR